MRGLSIVPLVACFAFVVVSKQAHADELRPEDLMSEATRRLDTLRERMWKIEDEASRSSNAGIALGLIAGAGRYRVDGETRYKANLAPIVAGRLYLFKADRARAKRARERLHHLTVFSYSDAVRAFDAVDHALKARSQAVEDSKRDATKQLAELNRMSVEVTDQLQGCPDEPERAPEGSTDLAPADSTAEPSGSDAGRRAQCREAREQREQITRRRMYVQDAERELANESAASSLLLDQVKAGRSELARILLELNAMSTAAEEAENGYWLLGGVYIEAFLGLAMDLYESGGTTSNDVIGGIGYGLGQLSLGVYAADHLVGAYIGATIPVFEK